MTGEINEASMTKRKWRDEDVASVALAEVASPRLAITKQFFTVHRLDEEPVACVRFDSDRWWVYARLKDEPYFWVSIVKRQADGLAATWGFSLAYANLYLAVSSVDLTSREITAMLGLRPHKTRQKGDLIGAGPKRYQEHLWTYRPSLPEPLGFEMKLAHLLRELSSRSEQLRLMQKSCDMSVSVAYYDYAGSPSGWHLDLEMLKGLFSLNLEIDVDLYVSGPELPD